MIYIEKLMILKIIYKNFTSSNLKSFKNNF